MSNSIISNIQMDENQNISISVIVPVYNAEQYVRQCLDSLLNQNKEDIEIICVDDGSTDNSLKILQEYKEKDKRIIVQTQKNLYAGAARNAGLELARGKYVIFLDSDDFFAPDMLSELYKIAEDNKAEIVIFGYYQYDNITKKTTPMPFKTKKSQLTNSRKLGTNIFDFCGAVPWNKILLRKYISSQNVKYQAIMNNNDEYFNRMIVVNAERLFFYNKRFVYYRVNNSNSLQGGLKRNVLCFGEALKAIYEELTNRNLLHDEIEVSFYNYAYRLIEDNLSRAKSFDDFEKIFLFLKSNVIPYVYSSKIIQQIGIIKNIMDSNLSGEFVFLFFTEKEKNLVPKSSWEYRIGEKFLYLPRKILKK